jgi:hypothetical protein
MSNITLSKSAGHHCWWLNFDGRATANFHKEEEVDYLVNLQSTIASQAEQLAKLKADDLLLRDALSSLVVRHFGLDRLAAIDAVEILLEGARPGTAHASRLNDSLSQTVGANPAGGE